MFYTDNYFLLGANSRLITIQWHLLLMSSLTERMISFKEFDLHYTVGFTNNRCITRSDDTYYTCSTLPGVGYFPYNSHRFNPLHTVTFYYNIVKSHEVTTLSYNYLIRKLAYRHATLKTSSPCMKLSSDELKINLDQWYQLVITYIVSNLSPYVTQSGVTNLFK